MNGASLAQRPVRVGISSCLLGETVRFMERVKIYGRSTVPTKSGRGLFAATLADRCPDLPIEEEGRLSDPQLRDNFVERVFAYGRLRALFGGRWNQGALVRFHTAHKLTLMAHSPAAYQKLGRLVRQTMQNRHEVPRGTGRWRRSTSAAEIA